MHHKYFVFLFVALLLGGCASSTWYEDYGVIETELGTDKAIVAAGEALSSGDRSNIKGAAHYLKSIELTENQATILSSHISEGMNDYSRRAIINSLFHHGYKDIAYPYVVTGLQSRNGRVRANSAKLLGSIGCEAKDSLPMLKIVSSNDGRGVQEQARIAYRQISLDCLSRGVEIEE